VAIALLLGHVEDYLIDEATWAIHYLIVTWASRYLIVDPRNPRTGTSVARP
jgi:hypothetical protein